MITFLVESALGMYTGLPLVILTVNDKEVILEVDQALGLATMLTEAAHTSKQDHLLFGSLTEEMGATVEEAGGILETLRQRRSRA